MRTRIIRLLRVGLQAATPNINICTHLIQRQTPSVGARFGQLMLWFLLVVSATTQFIPAASADDSTTSCLDEKRPRCELSIGGSSRLSSTVKDSNAWLSFRYSLSDRHVGWTNLDSLNVGTFALLSGGNGNVVTTDGYRYNQEAAGVSLRWNSNQDETSRVQVTTDLGIGRKSSHAENNMATGTWQGNTRSDMLYGNLEAIWDTPSWPVLPRLTSRLTYWHPVHENSSQAWNGSPSDWAINSKRWELGLEAEIIRWDKGDFILTPQANMSVGHDNTAGTTKFFYTAGPALRISVPSSSDSDNQDLRYDTELATIGIGHVWNANDTLKSTWNIMLRANILNVYRWVNPTLKCRYC